MKKLVTIVSAVMMLLMLAACVPSMTIDAEQAAAIDKGDAAISKLYAFAAALDTNKDDGISLDVKETITVDAKYLEDNASVVTIFAEDDVIAKGTKVTYEIETSTTDNSKTITLSVDGSYTIDGEEPVSVVFDGTASYDKDGKLTSADYNKFVVDGVGYEPTLAKTALSMLAYSASIN